VMLPSTRTSASRDVPAGRSHGLIRASSPHCSCLNFRLLTLITLCQMAGPKSIKASCYCSQCNRPKEAKLSLRTLKIHLKDDRIRLATIRASIQWNQHVNQHDDLDRTYLKFLEACIHKTEESLQAALAEEKAGVEAPGGESP